MDILFFFIFYPSFNRHSWHALLFTFFISQSTLIFLHDAHRFQSRYLKQCFTFISIFIFLLYFYHSRCNLIKFCQMWGKNFLNWPLILLDLMHSTLWFILTPETLRKPFFLFLISSFSSSHFFCFHFCSNAIFFLLPFL